MLRAGEVSISKRFFLDEPGERLLDADDIAWECGKDDEDPIGHDRQWRHQIFRKYPDEIAVDLARQYVSDYAQSGRHGAAYALSRCDCALFDFPFSRLLDDDDIRSLADSVAHRCGYITLDMPEDLAMHTVALIAREQGIALPKPATNAGVLARLKCPIWWRPGCRRSRSGRWSST